MKKVFSIVVTYNGDQWIQRCLGSLHHSSYPNEIIVIDNGSNDRTLEIIKTEFSSTHLHRSPFNLGFGKANNLGIAMALENGADYVFLLNQDAWVEQETIAHLVEAAQGNTALGIISPLHVTAAGNTFDHHFKTYLLKSGISDFLSEFLLPTQRRSNIIYTNFVNAAAWLVSKHCIEHTGAFDPFFFHYGEDRNFSHRAIYNGFKLGIVTTTKIYHDRADREKGKAQTLSKRVEKDRLNFLIDACNIRRARPQLFIAKRFMRWLLFSLLNLLLFRFSEASYNLRLFLSTFSSIPGIFACRRRGFRGGFNNKVISDSLDRLVVG